MMEDANRYLLDEDEQSQEEYEDYGYELSTTMNLTPMAGTKHGKGTKLGKCPYCMKISAPIKEYDPTSMTWNMCGSMCLLGCWFGCCLIPIFDKQFHGVTYFCSNCKSPMEAGNPLMLTRKLSIPRGMGL
ncbi:unnamed protein product [Blepharisma stoltei]|uniref:LITAF domain-containing protein n=1 Tax=Blepharisma stoltei TaxID=1481888 RepID=A0AAU9JS61_9CILI|nr:unnamed protein product [Blepharisma stoltei]